MDNLCEIREITNKEIQNLTGRKRRQVNRMLKLIRKQLGKKKGQIITIAEFCRIRGYDQVEVCKFLSIEKNGKKEK